MFMNRGINRFHGLLSLKVFLMQSSVYGVPIIRVEGGKVLQERPRIMSLVKHFLLDKLVLFEGKRI